MKDFLISCCSPVDLSAKYLEQRGVKYLPFKFYLAGKEFLDDLGNSISYDEFYQAMRDGADTKTTQMNVEDYNEYFSKLLENGKKILHVTLSSGLSGTSNSAKLSANEINEKYGEKMVYVVDSLGASSGYGLLVDRLCDLKEEGKTIEEVYNWAEENKKKVHYWFFTTDLTFFVRGGRVSKVSGWVGTLLKICPLLNVDKDGKLIPRQKVRGKKGVIKAIVEKMLEHAQDGTDYNQKCFISHSCSEEEALEVRQMVEENFPNLCGKVMVNSIGTTIGSHSGPGTVALFFFGDERVD